MIKLIKRKRYFRQNVSIFENVYTMQKLHKNGSNINNIKFEKGYVLSYNLRELNKLISFLPNPDT